MSIGDRIKQWREARGHSVGELEKRAGLPPGSIESFETGAADPTASALAIVAGALAIPVPWLYSDPEILEALMRDDSETSLARSADPVTEHILRAKPRAIELFHLLSTLVEHDDSRLLRAAEANLRSLVKEARRPLIPWASRQPGNFDPPSD